MRRRRVLIAVGLALAVTACGNPLLTAHERCKELGYVSAANVSADADGIYFNGLGEDQEYVNTPDLACLLGTLNAPDSLIDRMDNTTALMGVQEATWDGLRASWTFHPDNGLDVYITGE